MLCVRTYWMIVVARRSTDDYNLRTDHRMESDGPPYIITFKLENGMEVTI